MDIATGLVTGAEALVRWRRPGYGVVPPTEFIPVAESTGVIADIDLWVFDRACRQLVEWRATLPLAEGFCIATNLSAVTLRRPDLADRASDILAATAADPKGPVFEITETVLMSDAASTTKVLLALKNLGFQLAIDDFGTGFSSLAYLRRFPVDILKVDRSFVRGVATDTDDRAITRSVIALARSLRVRSTAEGVETVQQLEELRRLGCDDAQGFYFSRPISAGTLGLMLTKPWCGAAPPDPGPSVRRHRRRAPLNRAQPGRAVPA